MTSPLSSSTEVATRVHRVPLIGATAYVILEDEITVIDAGMRGSLPRLHAWITSIGRSPREIRRFVVTHAHPDHIGGAAGAEILLHPADRARSVRINAGAIARRVTGLPATVDLADGDLLPVLGGLRIIHAPGHTPGSVCLYAERDGLLFVGDALWEGKASVRFSDARSPRYVLRLIRARYLCRGLRCARPIRWCSGKC